MALGMDKMERINEREREKTANPPKKIFVGEGQGPTSKIMSREEQLRREALKNLQGGLEAGRARGQELFGGGMDLRGMTGQHLRSLQAQAAGGLGAPQFAQIRGAAEAGLAQQQAQNLRNLRIQQGASGIRGAAAQAGALRQQQQSDIARRGMEAKLAEASIGLQERGQQALGQQLGRERLGQLSTEFGYGGMHQAAFRGANQQVLAEKMLALAQADLAAAQGGGGGGGGGGGPSTFMGRLDPTGTYAWGEGLGMGDAMSGATFFQGGMPYMQAGKQVDRASGGYFTDTMERTGAKKQVQKLDPSGWSP